MIEKTAIKPAWQTSDGKYFNTEDGAEEHENKLWLVSIMEDCPGVYVAPYVLEELVDYLMQNCDIQPKAEPKAEPVVAEIEFYQNFLFPDLAPEEAD